METHRQHRDLQFASVLGAARCLGWEAVDTIALEFWHQGLESGYQCYLDFSQHSVRRMHHFCNMEKICFKAQRAGCLGSVCGLAGWGGGQLDQLRRLSLELWGVDSIEKQRS